MPVTSRETNGCDERAGCPLDLFSRLIKFDSSYGNFNPAVGIRASNSAQRREERRTAFRDEAYRRFPQKRWMRLQASSRSEFFAA
jgi:hypothetical protein